MSTKATNHLSDDSVPRWVWWGTLTGVALVAAITVFGAVLLRLGEADPPVAGPVTWEDRALRWASGPEVALAANEGAWWIAPQEAALPDGAFTLEVRAQITADSDPSAAWGAWLEMPDGARVIYAVSGEGYITTRRCPTGDIPPAEIEDCPALRPEWRWMPYPRVNSPGTANTITLHLERSGDVRLRLNGERLGAAPVARNGRWGVWARGGRDGGATLVWQRADIRGRSLATVTPPGP